MADLILIVPILTVIRYAIASSLLEHIKKVIITRHDGFPEYCQSKCLLRSSVCVKHTAIICVSWDGNH